MSDHRLFLFIEGNDDERFIETVLKSKFEEKYGSVFLWKYSQQPNKKIADFIKNIIAMGAEFIYLGDVNHEPCVTAKKQSIVDRLKNINEERIFVAVKEIESWYLAGLDKNSSEGLGIKGFTLTDDITKEQFNNLIPRRFDSRIDFMYEILKNFSIEKGKRKNKSFRYFIKKNKLAA
jgi:hypothetical protein